MILSKYVYPSRGHNSAIMTVIKILFPLCMSELSCKFHIPGSGTVGVVAEVRTVLQCDIVKICISFKGT